VIDTTSIETWAVLHLQIYIGCAMAAKRLIKELDAYNRDGSSAVSSLEAVEDEDLFHLTAILRGPEETAYEGIELFTLSNARE